MKQPEKTMMRLNFFPSVFLKTRDKTLETWLVAMSAN
jgi:hypothetical protein